MGESETAIDVYLIQMIIKNLNRDLNTLTERRREREARFVHGTRILEPVKGGRDER